VISRNNEPTDWVSSLVITPKPNRKPRVCLDPQPLNKALKTSRYAMPTLEDVFPELSQARDFSLTDVF
jgi:hypothetical protein